MDLRIEAEAAHEATCTVAPRSIEEIRALVAASPVAGEVSLADSLEAGLPTGRDAPEDVVLELAWTVGEWMACINSGDQLRMYALFTDRNLLGASQLGFDISQFEAMVATPQPRPTEDQLVAFAIWGTRVLLDGRAAAFVRFGHEVSGIENAQTRFVLFRQTGERWLIDDGVGQNDLLRLGIDITPPKETHPIPGVATSSVSP